ncbi:hypothetical protein [Paenibacillus taichungensis]|uniref:hypothetical protein n=1 Tax=Paenibacillus taichungensis TaxID=484184 RepID=UPI00117FF455|nr:hypothetical protein [Paenibacillus taichungensis]
MKAASIGGLPVLSMTTREGLFGARSLTWKIFGSKKYKIKRNYNKTNLMQAVSVKVFIVAIR